MSELSEDLVATERQGDDPPIPEPTAEEIVERDTAADTLEIPDSNAEGGKAIYVPGSALKGARDEIKGLKAELESARAGSARAAALEGHNAQLQGTLAQYAPVVQAYQAMTQQAQQVQQPTADDPDAEAFARNLDLYTAEGKPDVGKARAILSVVDQRAASQARASVQPLAAHTVNQQSQAMLARALATKTPSGAKPHPDDLKSVWSRLDPALTATREGAQQVYLQAVGISEAMGRMVKGTADEGVPRGTDGKFSKADIPAPLHSERAGGRDTPETRGLSASEERFIKSEGMTVAEYLKSAGSMPGSRR